MSIFIVFSQSFPCMFMGFNVRVECERLVKNCEEQGNLQLAWDWLGSGQLTKGHVGSTCWKLKHQVPRGILQFTSRLGQLVRCTASLF